MIKKNDENILLWHRRTFTAVFESRAFSAGLGRWNTNRSWNFTVRDPSQISKTRQCWFMEISGRCPSVFLLSCAVFRGVILEKKERIFPNCPFNHFSPLKIKISKMLLVFSYETPVQNFVALRQFVPLPRPRFRFSFGVMYTIPRMVFGLGSFNIGKYHVTTSEQKNIYEQPGNSPLSNLNGKNSFKK